MRLDDFINTQRKRKSFARDFDVLVARRVLGLLFRAARKELDLATEDVAERASVPLDSVRCLERGLEVEAAHSREILHVLRKGFAALGVPLPIQEDRGTWEFARRTPSAQMRGISLDLQTFRFLPAQK